MQPMKKQTKGIPAHWWETRPLFAAIGVTGGFAATVFLPFTMDALVSVLVLQNTLSIAVEGCISPRLFRLVAISSAGILLIVFTVSVAWFMRGRILCRKKC